MIRQIIRNGLSSFTKIVTEKVSIPRCTLHVHCDDFSKKILKSVRYFCQKQGFCPYNAEKGAAGRASLGH